MREPKGCGHNPARKQQQPTGQEVIEMTRYYKTGTDRKPQKISKQEADKMVERNQDIFNQVLNGADFSKLLEIEIPLKIER